MLLVAALALSLHFLFCGARFFIKASQNGKMKDLCPIDVARTISSLAKLEVGAKEPALRRLMRSLEPSGAKLTLKALKKNWPAEWKTSTFHQNIGKAKKVLNKDTPPTPPTSKKVPDKPKPQDIKARNLPKGKIPTRVLKYLLVE